MDLSDDSDSENHFNPIICCESKTVLPLKRLCGKKLVSDVYYVRRLCPQLPNSILCYLLAVAIKEGRVLSASYLLQHYPEDTLTLREDFISTKEGLCNKVRGYALHETLPLKPVYISILYTFGDIVQGRYPNSKLRVLDLKEVPLNFLSIKTFYETMSRENESGKPSDYILKLNLIIHDHDSLYQLSSAKNKFKHETTIAKTDLVGLHFNDFSFKKTEVTNHLDNLELKDLEYFSFYFCEVKSPEIFVLMKTFHNLRTIDFSYTFINFSKNTVLLDAFSKALHELVHVSHINLRSCKISGHLEKLFQQFCVKDTETPIKRQKTEKELCCPAHRAELLYLNLSDCDPKREDLHYLSTSTLTKKLKYLNLGYYKVEMDCLTELLKSLSSSLQTLDLSCTIFNNITTDGLFRVLYSMKKLQFLNLTGIQFEEAYISRKIGMLKEESNLVKIMISQANADIEIDFLRGGSLHFKHSDNVLEFLNIHT